MVSDPNNINTFEWVFQHLQILTPAALVYAVWRITRFFTIVENRVLNAEGHLVSMATNHFPHMEASLQNQDVLLGSMDKSLRTLVEGPKSDRTPRARRRK